MSRNLPVVESGILEPVFKCEESSGTKEGLLYLIAGPMNSGKSFHTIERARLLRLGRKRVALCNHSNDNRYTEEEVIISKGGMRCPARKIKDLSELTNEWLMGLDDLLIDEGHMFSNLLFHYRRICKLGVNFHIGVVNLDLFREPFPSVKELYPYCYEILLLKAKCSFCGVDCIYSKLKYNSDLVKLKNGNILIGGDELWINSCGDCFDKDYSEFEKTNTKFIDEYRKKRLKRSESDSSNNSPKSELCDDLP